MSTTHCALVSVREGEQVKPFQQLVAERSAKLVPLGIFEFGGDVPKFQEDAGLGQEG